MVNESLDKLLESLLGSSATEFSRISMFLGEKWIAVVDPSLVKTRHHCPLFIFYINFSRQEPARVTC